MVPQNATTASTDFASPELGSTISSLCRTATKRGAASTVPPTPPTTPLAKPMFRLRAKGAYVSNRPCSASPFSFATALSTEVVLGRATFLAQPAQRPAQEIAARQPNRNELRNTSVLQSERFSPTSHSNASTPTPCNLRHRRVPASCHHLPFRSASPKRFRVSPAVFSNSISYRRLRAGSFFSRLCSGDFTSPSSAQASPARHSG